jgi:serine protease
MLSARGASTGHRLSSISVTRHLTTAAACALATLAALAVASPALASAAPDYLPGVVLVGYRSGPAASIAAHAVETMGVRQTGPAPGPDVHLLRVKRGGSIWKTIARLRRQAGVAYAVPDYLAHQVGTPATPSPGTTATGPSWIPDDPGKGGAPGDWQSMQWNFLAGAGVDAPQAWANLMADGHPGGSGVTVAILDTGVAYRNWQQFRKSPDFAGTHFVDPYDFIAGNRYPVDRNGHGTFVAGEIAEATNNGLGLTGLAYGASIMPVRVLDKFGWGDAATISRGIRYAVTHGAKVINLSLEFDPSVTAGEIPDILSAIEFAHRRGVVVVAASGNEGEDRIAYPARAPAAVSVGATTADKCIADYSNGGAHLDLVAPGGGDDSSLPSDPDCDPDKLNMPDIYQMTFFNSSHPGRFGYPGGWFGTSMASPEVAATAALVIASGVIGRHPTPNQVLARLEATAVQLGPSKPNLDYGYGLLDAGAATAPSGTAPTSPTPTSPAPSSSAPSS